MNYHYFLKNLKTYGYMSTNNNTDTTAATLPSQPPDTGAASQENQTVTFIEAAGQVIENWSQNFDDTSVVADTPQVDLGEFLKRPVRIDSVVWSQVGDGGFTLNINPWADFLSHTNVVDKLRRFALIKGNMNVRFVINGSPFLYGRIICGVVPFGGNNLPFQTVDGATTLATRQPMINYLSQGQHVFLDPSTNSTVEVVIPFLSVKNWIRLYNDTTSSPQVRLLPDVITLPHVQMEAINPLRVGNASTGNAMVNITVFAWMTDVHLAVPTATNILAVAPTQESDRKKGGFSNKKKSKKLGQENTEEKEAAEGKATISGIASAVSGSLALLESVPVIGPFAMAGSIASGAVSSIAKMFGFSRPMLLQNSTRYYPEIFSNPASTVGAFTGYKMSVDPSNGVSVDPRVANLNPQDEMAISCIAARESFVTPISWTETNRSTDGTAVLFVMEVIPFVNSIADIAPDPSGPTTIIQPTAVAFAAYPFYYWRGTMKYRLQMVASQYHRGKLAIYYEPNPQAMNLGGGVTFTPNTHFTTILDLQDVDNYEFEIPWYSSFPMLRMPPISPVDFMAYSPFPGLSGARVAPRFGDAFSNGFFRIQVINELNSATVPVPPVEINIYVSCPDLQVAYPRTMLRSSFNVTSSNLLTIGEVEQESSTSVGGFDMTTMGNQDILGGTADTNNNFRVVCGENIVSFRTLLKRFNGNFMTPTPVTTNDLTLRIPMYPTKNYLLDVAGNFIVPLNMGIFEYLVMGFVAIRGGYRHMVRVYTAQENGYYTVRNRASIVNTTPDTINNYAGDSEFMSTIGSTTNPKINNDGISFELPYYTSSRFFPGQCANMVYQPAEGYYMDNSLVGATVTYRQLFDSKFEYRGYVDSAAADDFAMMGFWAAPPRNSWIQ